MFNYGTKVIMSCSIVGVSVLGIDAAVIVSMYLFNMYGLLTKCEVKMAGYWSSPFLRVYGPRRS